MSAQLNQMRDQLTKWTESLSPASIVSATVKAVNSDDTIAIVFPEGGEIDDCRLRSVQKDGDKILLLPAVNSTVLVGRIEKSEEFVVLAVEEITEFVVKIGNTSYSQTATGFLVEKDGDTLLDVMKLIIEAVMQIVVIQGQNPDYTKLQSALQKAQNILRNAT